MSKEFLLKINWRRPANEFWKERLNRDYHEGNYYFDAETEKELDDQISKMENKAFSEGYDREIVTIEKFKKLK